MYQQRAMTKMYRRLNYGLLVLATMLSMEPPGSRAFQLSVAGLQPFEASQRPQQRLRVPLLPKLDMTGTQYVDKHFRSTTKRAHQQLERVFHKDGTTWGSPSNAGPEPLNEATKAAVELSVNTLKNVITALFAGREFARFYVLETVARVPYFSYLSVLHLFESFGLHDRAAWIKVHFAEADNE